VFVLLPFDAKSFVSKTWILKGKTNKEVKMKESEQKKERKRINACKIALDVTLT